MRGKLLGWLVTFGIVIIAVAIASRIGPVRRLMLPDEPTWVG